MKAPQIVIAIFLTIAALLSGCASTDTRPVSSYSGAAYGVIDAIDITLSGSDGMGAGAVIGGVVGGAMVGHQIEPRNL